MPVSSSAVEPATTPRETDKSKDQSARRRRVKKDQRNGQGLGEAAGGPEIEVDCAEQQGVGIHGHVEGEQASEAEGQWTDVPAGTGVECGDSTVPRGPGRRRQRRGRCRKPVAGSGRWARRCPEAARQPETRRSATTGPSRSVGPSPARPVRPSEPRPEHQGGRAGSRWSPPLEGSPAGRPPAQPESRFYEKGDRYGRPRTGRCRSPIARSMAGFPPGCHCSTSCADIQANAKAAAP